MHHEVEVRANEGGWLRDGQRFGNLAEAQTRAENVRAAGGMPRIVRVAEGGTRKVVE